MGYKWSGLDQVTTLMQPISNRALVHRTGRRRSEAWSHYFLHMVAVRSNIETTKGRRRSSPPVYWYQIIRADWNIRAETTMLIWVYGGSVYQQQCDGRIHGVVVDSHVGDNNRSNKSAVIRQGWRAELTLVRIFNDPSHMVQQEPVWMTGTKRGTG